jgi:hypothetical protein
MMPFKDHISQVIKLSPTRVTLIALTISLMRMKPAYGWWQSYLKFRRLLETPNEPLIIVALPTLAGNSGIGMPDLRI